ncbi:MAG: hypothetical protein AAF547_16675 [Actinomycetota bacterium]
MSTSLTSQLQSARHQVADDADLQAWLRERGWTDGLPVVPPTPERVASFLEWAVLPPDHLVGIEPVRGRAVTAEKVAINAVLAGCSPAQFPVIVTAVTALLADEFALHGPTASTGGAGILLVVNGPARAEAGMTGTFSALGAGDPAATVIARAVRLVLANVLDVRPGGIDRSTLGHPGKLGFCVAEDEEHSPWPALAADRLGLAATPGTGSDVSAVTALAAMGPRQIMNEWTTEPEEILDTFAAEMRANMRHYSIWGGDYALIIPPQLRDHLAAAGWSRADIQRYIHERARINRSEWAEVGKGSVVMDKGDRSYAALPSADDLLVIAAGGPAGGFGAVIPPWLGTKSRAVTVPVGACVNC